MGKFRLKLDLSQFFGDVREKAYIVVDPAWNTVKCLQLHVEMIFNLQDLQFLTEDGWYIPPKESIEVIKTTDVLRAINAPDKCVNKLKVNKKLKMINDKDSSSRKEIQKHKHLYDDSRVTSFSASQIQEEACQSTTVTSTVVNTRFSNTKSVKNLCNDLENVARSVKELATIWESRS